MSADLDTALDSHIFFRAWHDSTLERDLQYISKVFGNVHLAFGCVSVLAWCLLPRYPHAGSRWSLCFAPMCHSPHVWILAMSSPCWRSDPVKRAKVAGLKLAVVSKWQEWHSRMAAASTFSPRAPSCAWAFSRLAGFPLMYLRRVAVATVGSLPRCCGFS